MFARLVRARRVDPAQETGGSGGEQPQDERRGLAVVALETTGLFARRGDRIVEIAVVSLDAECHPVGEWSTLVNPVRDVGAVHVHGIKPSQVAAAPTLPLIAGDVAAQLADRVLVAHDLRLVLAFLDAEMLAAGFEVAWRPGISTMTLAAALAGPVGRSLGSAASALGLEGVATHRALADARLTAAVLRTLTERSSDSIMANARPIPASALPGVVPSGRAASREIAEPLPAGGLAGLVDGIAVSGLTVDAEPDAMLAYTDLLDRILGYGRLTADEVWELRRIAIDWGMGTLAIEEVHRAYFGGLSGLRHAGAGLGEAMTDEEWADVVALAEALCVPRRFWAEGAAQPTA